MDYKDSFEDRVASFDVADIECESFLEKNKVEYMRYGFDQHNDRIKSEQWFKLPRIIRNKPDFIIFQSKASFLEVKGCKDMLRLKICDIDSYDFYKKIMPLTFFLYSTTFNEYKLVPYNKLKVLTTIAPIGKYEDNGKEYFKIDWVVIQ